MSDPVLALLVVLIALYVAVWLFILLPARMARARGRSVVFWVLVSILFSPILACLLLLILGGGLTPRRPRHET